MKTPAITLASLEARPECFCFPPPRNRKLQSPSGEESGYSGVPGLESPKGVSADRSGYKSDLQKDKEAGMWPVRKVKRIPPGF